MDSEIMPVLPEIVSIELNKLRDDIQHLKQCQLDYTKFATNIFIYTIAAIGAVLFSAPAIVGLQENPFNSTLVCSICLALALIAAFTLPYMAWVIIHKCRSIFRIVAYVRMIEKQYIDNKFKECYLGYENTYSYMRRDPWLLIRRSASGDSYSTYRTWLERAVRAQADAEGQDESWIQAQILRWSMPVKEEDKVYIGNYYEKLVNYIMRLHNLSKIVATSLCIIHVLLKYTSIINGDAKWDPTSIFSMLLGVVITVIIWNWSSQEKRRNKRYIEELKGLPFSQRAHYEMWKRAFKNAKEDEQSTDYDPCTTS